jgi:hypothetical protein
LLQIYFGKKLHWLGGLALNWKFAPTTIGWSEVTGARLRLSRMTLFVDEILAWRVA